MKRAILAVLMLVVCASPAAALSAGPGGYVYWSELVRPGVVADIDYVMYQSTIDTSWGIVGSGVNFDNVALYNTNNWSSGHMYYRHGLEVYDPRHEGGTGQIMHLTINKDDQDQVPHEDPNGPSDYAGQAIMEPWDIVLCNPTTKVQTTVFDGVIYDYNDAYADRVSRAARAPENWVPGDASNGMAFWIATTDGRVSYLHDTNGSGDIDNAWSGANSEINYFTQIREETLDLEFGGDGALYTTRYRYNYPYVVRRHWIDGSGALQNKEFYTLGGSKPIGYDSDGMGLAVGPVASNPIVYLLAMDNTSGAGSERMCVWALQDMNNDNDAEDAGELFKVWRDTEFGIDVSNSDGGYGGEDIEFYQNPATGVKFLVFSDYYNNLYVLELADNGLRAVDGGTIATGAGNAPGGYISGFELDLNYLEAAAIPEPGTMLLLGTGALGVIGVIRRRRMK